MDADGWACAVTCTNGEGCGEVVPGTGIHLNNMMGEQDLSPFGFFTHPPGAPAAVDDGPDDGARRRRGGAAARAGLGRLEPDPLGDPAGRRRRASTAGSTCRRRSRRRACTRRTAIVYVEPGLDVRELEAEERTLVRFTAPNLFFGGAQAVRRHPVTGELSGGSDPRRGGAVAVAG